MFKGIVRLDTRTKVNTLISIKKEEEEEEQFLSFFYFLFYFILLFYFLVFENQGFFSLVCVLLCFVF